MNGQITEFTRKWGTRIVLVAALAITIAILTQVPILRMSLVERLELSTLDYRFARRGPLRTPADSSAVVIVEISQDAFRSIPERYPWPRSHYAALLRNLKRAGARVVGFDLIFSDADTAVPADDSLFRAAIRETGIAVLAAKREQDNPLFIASPAQRDFGTVFFNVDSCIGLVNLRPDADGIYRLYNASYFIDTSAMGGIRVPTFAFACLNKWFDLPPFTTPDPANGEFLYAGRQIPQYDPGSLLVNFYGPSGAFPHVGFQDVLDDSTFTTLEESSTGEQINTFSDPEYGYLVDGTFRDKIVLVGVTVPEYKDLFPVSLGRGEQRGDNLMYGVEIHANVIENILRGDFLTVQSFLSQVLMIVALTSFAFFAISGIKAWKSSHHLLIELAGLLFTGILIVAVFALSLLLFSRMNYVLSVTPALLSVAGGYITSTVYHFLTERKQRILIKSMFSTYVDPAVVDELIAHPERLVLGGRRENLTVLFSDIEGFTTFSQDMEPEKLVALLNEYLNAMSEVIFRHRGTVDKYEGDAIMAFWGAPVPEKNHALLACMSALSMIEELQDLNRRWEGQGKPHLNIRIGINTGSMVVGNMGSSGKFAYTVIGDSVNLASRLEGANKEYRTALMVSESTYELVKTKILCRKLDRIAVKGRSAPVTTYELLQSLDRPVDPLLKEFLTHYDKGLNLYFQREWKDAGREFERAIEIRPNDGPAMLYRSRCSTYENTPPPEGWDGVFILQSK